MKAATGNGWTSLRLRFGRRLSDLVMASAVMVGLLVGAALPGVVA